MRMSKLLFNTLRTAPGQDPVDSKGLLQRAGYVQDEAALNLLPLGLRVRSRLEQLLEDSLAPLDAQQVSLELADHESTRTREAILAMQRLVRSHRQLPRTVYQLQERRDGALAFDAFTLQPGAEALELAFGQFQTATGEFLATCGLECLLVEAGSETLEFFLPYPAGNDTALVCPECEYRSRLATAAFVKPQGAIEAARPAREVATPGATTIESLTRVLGVSAKQTAKAVFLMPHAAGNEEREVKLIFAVVRGDMMLSESKLGQLLQADSFRPATEAEISGVSAEAGYGSPIGVQRERITLVVDDAVADTPNLVAGANRAGYHLLDTNHGRDYQADLIADIAQAEAGCACPRCSASLALLQGKSMARLRMVPVTETTGLTYLDAANLEQPVRLATLASDVAGLLSSCAEVHHDELGLNWPVNLAPWQVLIVSLAGKADPAVADLAEGLYTDLEVSGLSVLLDDRDLRAGVKFNDADLLGIPLRITVGSRVVQSGLLEVKLRGSGEVLSIAIADGVADILKLVMALPESGSA